MYKSTKATFSYYNIRTGRFMHNTLDTGTTGFLLTAPTAILCNDANKRHEAQRLVDTANTQFQAAANRLFIEAEQELQRKLQELHAQRQQQLTAWVDNLLTKTTAE